MALPEIDDFERVQAAIDKAREHAQDLGKPIQLDRVALYLGVNAEEMSQWLRDAESSKDERKKLIAKSLKMAKQEGRADIMDALSDKGNVTGFIFQGKANHGMIETMAHDVKFSAVNFVGEDGIKE